MINSAWKEFNSNSKDINWFRRILLDIQNRKTWLISFNEYAENQSFADGSYNTKFAEKLFDTFNQPVADLNIDFSPLDLLGNRINSIVSMIEKQGWSVRAQTTDPTARDKRDADIELLKAEKEIEGMRKKLGNAMGLSQPLPLAKEEDFSSDISPLSKMGLDISNPIDEAIFKDYLQRQVWEISLEVAIQHYLKENEHTEKLKLILPDLINSGCAAQQVVVNSFSGEVQLSYLYPFNVYQILAKQNDGKDAIAKGWEKNVAVRDIIALMGKDIKVEDLDQILQYANTTGTTQYQGIWFPAESGAGGYSYPPGREEGKCCTWNAFLNLTCSLGYLEVKSQNSDLYLHKLENGNLNTSKEPYDYNPPQNVRKVNSIKELKKDSDRFLEYKFYDVTYKAYYLPFTNMIWGFGKLPLAVRYGTKNELTDFSIVTQKLKGKSMTRKCIPFIKHIMTLWVRIQHFINESRPSGESWDIDVVRELAQEIIGLDGNQSKILETLKVLQNTTNTVHKTVKMVNDQPIGGDGDPVKARVRGLDPTVLQMYDLIQRDKNQIIEITGVSDVLLATQSTQGGLGVSQLALQQSLNTIYYIQSAAQKLFSDVCFNIGQKVQYIIDGDKSAEAYKSLVQAIGQRNVDALALMGTTPTFAFSIFMEFGMNQLQREQVDRLTELMIQSKTITASQAFQIKDINNWKVAAALLSYYEQKSLQAQQQAAAAQLQGGMMVDQQKHQQEMERLNLEGQWKDKVANTTGEWAYRQEQLKVQGKDAIEDKRQVSKMLHTSQEQENELERMNNENLGL